MCVVAILVRIKCATIIVSFRFAIFKAIFKDSSSCTCYTVKLRPHHDLSSTHIMIEAPPQDVCVVVSPDADTVTVV